MTNPLPPYLPPASLAVTRARTVRRHHARRTEPHDPRRRAEIADALGRLRAAMDPIRRRLAEARGGNVPPHEVAKCRRYSAAIQAERRKLWKMK